MKVNNAADDRTSYRYCKQRETKAGDNRSTYIHTDIARRKKDKDVKLTVKSGGFWGYSHLIPTSIFTIPPWGCWRHR
jgi:hypothetical protein